MKSFPPNPLSGDGVHDDRGEKDNLAGAAVDVDADVLVRRCRTAGDDDTETSMPFLAKSVDHPERSRTSSDLHDAASHNHPSHIISCGPVRAACRRCCPRWTQNAFADSMNACAGLYHRCKPASSSTPESKHERGVTSTWEGLCHVVVRLLLLLSTAVKSGVRLVCGTSSSGPRRLCRCASPVSMRVLRLLLPVLVSALCLAVWCGACFTIWVYEGIMADPYAEMRIQLSVVYAPDHVEKTLQRTRQRHPKQPKALSSQKRIPMQTFMSNHLQAARQRYEKKVLAYLVARYARTHANASQIARTLMSEFLQEVRPPSRRMIGDYPIVRNVLPHTGETLVMDPADGTTVAQRMLVEVRSAVRRCTHGVPTLPAPPPRSDGHGVSATEQIADALWSTFAEANAVTPVHPHCLARSQPRMPCADVGITQGSGIAVTADAPAGEGSRVQYLYEHGRLSVNRSAVAQLYYDSTPGLPAKARAWRATTLNSTGGDEHNVSPLQARVHDQQERFLRTSSAGGDGRDGGSSGGTRPISGVILFLSGAADRDPVGRDNSFTKHALPMLESNLLKRYPHYPVHIFYEAAAPRQSPAPVWTLTDVLRHSDVYTVLHDWKPSTTTHVGSNGQAIHVAPPPPVLVDSVSQLLPMRAQQAPLRKWFSKVSSCVPSAPYVTFENIAPLFSTLPCGVSEDDVESWLREPWSAKQHRRGYRQMCRFWAMLVWRLPSLRVWTDSEEGRNESLVFSDATDVPHSSTLKTLPPWRYRYTYYLRLDTDSYLHRPVACDPFVTMLAQRCAYGYNAVVRDADHVVKHLGTAFTEWIDRRTSIKDTERVQKNGDGGESRVLSEAGEWGRLTDPSLGSTVTLVPATTTAMTGENASLLSSLPPLPPTWPWHGVFPEHSSTALSAAEKDVLRTYFFSDGVGQWNDRWRHPKNYVKRGIKRDEMLAERLAGNYALGQTYNLGMYFNNFELGTFALKNHPLYTSAVQFFDNNDYDDATGPEREAEGFDLTLQRVKAGDAPGVKVPSRFRMKVYQSPVYLLRRKNLSATTPSTTRNEFATQSPATRTVACRSRRSDADGVGNVPARDVARDWRSGYMQFRWGDAPIHTFGVEAVMQREGWGVCEFAEEFGWYEHGDYVPR